MRFVDLFAGIGGFSLGLERAGMTCVGHVENEPYCQKILKKHWPDVPLMGDVRDVKGNEFGTVDLVCGGFPCQPFSVAGKREGAEDDRYLWPEMYRVIELLKPSWVVGENVTGLDGLALDRVLSDLEGGGYEVLTFEIPACAVNAPHRRARLWIVGHAGHTEPSRWDKDSKRGEREPCDESASSGSGDVAHSGRIGAGSEEAGSGGRNIRQEKIQRSEEGDRSGNRSQGDAGNPYGAGLGKQGGCESVGEKQLSAERGGGSGWEDCHWVEGWDGKYRRIPQSGICLLDDGIPERVARLKALGNAVVPQVVERIGRAIMDTEMEEE